MLPYLGAESAVPKCPQTLRCLELTLQGKFQRVSVCEVANKTGNGIFVMDGIFAKPATRASKKADVLDGACELLQIDMTSTRVHYLVASAARALLSLDGALFHELSNGGNLATHVALIQRPEPFYDDDGSSELHEADVIVNAHPRLGNAVSIAGKVNEPLPKNGKPSMAIVHASAHLLPDGDPLLLSCGVSVQPPGAVAAWRAHIKSPAGMPEGGTVSERMVLYHATRHSYPLKEEMTVDYGPHYARHYATREHAAKVRASPLAPMAPNASGLASFKRCWGRAFGGRR